MARLVELGIGSGIASFATFLVSGFWHGVYPFFYVMFFIAAILQECAKDAYKARHLWYTFIPKPLRHIIAN